ncbi:MAG: DUF4381 domain-containing protein [Gammaproteobacteria bacterium]
MPDSSSLPLRDIHLPAEIAWWPPAVGWWLLLAGIILIAVAAWWWYRRRRRLRFAATTLALKELEAIEADFRAGICDAGDAVRRLSILMRRLSISLFPRSEAAGLTGEAWLSFLDGVLQRPAFSSGAGRVLHEGPYRPSVENEEVEPLLVLCREWIETVGKQRR